MQPKDLFAAIDLGSNSFRLEIGQLIDGSLRRVDYLKETVRQGNGLDADRNLSEEAMQRGLNCLARFAERLAGFRKENVRAVATQTLREARNRQEFLTRAYKVLGFPIEVINGKEEARLIYLGVSHLLPQSDERRLVIDIGGRSTELILGQGYEPTTLESFRLGSVAWSMKYFENGMLSLKNFAKAQIAAKAVLDEAESTYAPGTWDRAYGSSGTVGAVFDILVQAGRTQDSISLVDLEWLQNVLVEAQKPEKIELAGLKPDRRPVIGGGLSVLKATMELLQIERLYPASGALRHGVLFNLIDRENPVSDVRDRMIDWLARRFLTDVNQAARVRAVALNFFEQLLGCNASLTDQEFEFELRSKELGWAAQLHEVGMYIAHADYHKHGAYILENTDLSGFTNDELHRVGQLVLGHRGKLAKLAIDFEDDDLVCCLLALRLAAILCHARREPDLRRVRLQVNLNTKQFTLNLPRDWQSLYPQSVHLLELESAAWQKAPWSFQLQTTA